MKIKFYVKSTCALLIAFLTSVSSFAMQSPTKMPDFARSMLIKMHKPLSDEIKLAKLDNYMHGICKKIFSPDNTNFMVKWAREHSKSEDVNKIIYQIWAIGPNYTEADIDSNSVLGINFYVLSKKLREDAKKCSDLQTNKYFNFATEYLCRTYRKSKENIISFHSQELRQKVDDLLRQGDCWYSFNQPGSGFWSEKVTKELIGNNIITLRQMIDILSKTAERTDFFGTCMISACIAYKKCEELGLSCEFAKNNNYYVVFVNSNGKRYIVNYLAGVLNIAANGIVCGNIIQEINDITYKKWQIIPLNMSCKIE